MGHTMNFRLIPFSEARIGSWVHQVDINGSRLCFVACWESDENKLLIEVTEDGATIVPQTGGLLSAGELEIVPDMRTARRLSEAKAGTILVTQRGLFLVAMTEKGALFNVNLESGVAPQDTTGAVSIPAWSLVTRFGNAERVLLSAKT